MHMSLPVERALADLEGLIEEGFPSVVAGLYFTKAWDWSTESEFRFLLHGNVDAYEYIDINEALTGVFCGSRFPEARFADLRTRCPELWDAGRVFRIVWRNGLPVVLPATSLGSATGVTWDVPPAPSEPSLGIGGVDPKPHDDESDRTDL